MSTDWFFARLAEWGDARALVANEQATTYAELQELCEQWLGRFRERAVGPGMALAIEGSFSPQVCAAFLAAMRLGAVLVPLTPLMRAHRDKFLEIAEVSLLLEVDEADAWTLSELPQRVSNPLTLVMSERQHPGLVIFSSGSTGAPKAILHDLTAILEKFRKPR